MIRNNLVGKRVEQSARSVIGPDATLKTGQVAIPPQIAQILTVPVQVTNYNIDFLQNLVNTGKANYVLTDNKQKKIVLANALFFRGTLLNHGDTIYRQDKHGNEVHIPVMNGKDILQVGDRLKRNGVFIDVEYPEKRDYKINIGDVVERHLMNKDFVLLNPKN